MQALDKNVDVKKKACESIRGTLADYDPSISDIKPGKMLRATTLIAVRMIRDKMWAIFTQGVSLVNTLFDHFLFSHPVPRKEVADSSVKFYNELLTR